MNRFVIGLAVLSGAGVFAAASTHVHAAPKTQINITEAQNHQQLARSGFGSRKTEAFIVSTPKHSQPSKYAQNKGSGGGSGFLRDLQNIGEALQLGSEAAKAVENSNSQQKQCGPHKHYRIKNGKLKTMTHSHGRFCSADHKHKGGWGSLF